MPLTKQEREYRSFSWAISGLTALVFGILFPYLFGAPVRLWLIGICAAFALWGTVFPGSLKFPYKAWMAFGHVMGKFNTFLILNFFFYFFLSPIALLLRIAGRKDSLDVSIDANLPSYRKKSVIQEKDRMKEMF